MQVIPRELTQNNWTLIVLILGFVLLFFMKVFQSSRLLGYTISFFTRGFIEKRAEEKLAFFSTFHILLFSFSSLTISLFIHLITVYYKATLNNFSSFLLIFTFTSIYLTIRYIIDYSFGQLLNISDYVRYFIFTKSGYLYTLSIWLFPVLIIYFFGFKNNYFLLGSFLLLVLIRFGLVFYNNKKLIIKHLFYFILYLCALEMAPLFLLFKFLK